MNRERKLAHIVAYYLSRFDKEALSHLGFKTDKEAFTHAATILNLVPNYFKFRRDEFDVAHPHRKGWHKRPMTLSIINTINALHELNEPTLRGIVEEILSKGSDSSIEDNLDQLTLIFPNDTNKRKKRTSKTFTSRAITGKKAEEYFINWYEENKTKHFPETKLHDVRELGCGYDFEIIDNQRQKYFYEVKGISSSEGGILFTNKEWETAQVLANRYNLVIVSNIDEAHVIKIINNPAEVFNPKRNISTVIQVNWALTAKEIITKSN